MWIIYCPRNYGPSLAREKEEGTLRWHFHTLRNGTYWALTPTGKCRWGCPENQRSAGTSFCGCKILLILLWIRKKREGLSAFTSYILFRSPLLGQGSWCSEITEWVPASAMPKGTDSSARKRGPFWAWNSLLKKG